MPLPAASTIRACGFIGKERKEQLQPLIRRLKHTQVGVLPDLAAVRTQTPLPPRLRDHNETGMQKRE